MPQGSKRPYTRAAKDDVKTVKKGKMAGSNEAPGGYATAKSNRARDTGKRPKKRNALAAAKHRVSNAIAKGKKVTW